MSYLIICISDQLAGETAEVDSETDIAYEAWVDYGGMPALSIYPKLYWRPIAMLEVPLSPYVDSRV